MIKFILGVIVGSILGLIVMSLAVTAKNADREMGIDDKN